MFKFLAGVDMLHVPYRGAAPAHIDLAGGRVHMIFDNIPQSLALARDGKVRALAVTGAKRSPQAPEIPTMAEFLPGFEITSWGGVCAPTGISPALIQRINELTKKSLESEDIKKRFYDNGATTWYTTAEEFVKFRAANEAAFAPLIRASGAKVD
jgi:tripartite-type tricarboxylate transporter receptor subunit TctC